MIQPITFAAAPNSAPVKTSFAKVINHSFYFYENGSTKRTPVPKDAIQKAINAILIRQPRFDELSVNGQINLVRQELRTMNSDKCVY